METRKSHFFHSNAVLLLCWGFKFNQSPLDLFNIIYLQLILTQLYESRENGDITSVQDIVLKSFTAAKMSLKTSQNDR